MRRTLFLLPLFLLLVSSSPPPANSLPTQHIHTVVGVSTLYLSFGETGVLEVGPTTGFVGGGTPQTITTTWTSGGLEHEIETRVGGDMDLAIQRHDRLLNKLLVYYPKDE